MKKVFIICIIIFSSNIAIADAGYSYRFSAKILTKDSDTISGYIYFGSYKKFDLAKYGRDIKNYFIESKQLNYIKIYPFISTYIIGDTDIDFALKQSSNTIQFDNISSIYSTDILEYPVSQRLVELELQEMKLLKNYQPSVKFVYDKKYSVMSIFAIISWKKDRNLEEIQKKILKKLRETIQKNKSVNSENIKPFFNYLKKLKKEMLSDGILLFELWGSL